MKQRNGDILTAIHQGKACLRGIWVWLMVRAFFPLAKIGSKCRFYGPLTVTHAARASINIGRECVFNKIILSAFPGARMTIGQRCSFNYGFILGVMEEITIGNDCLIGEYVSIRDHSHQTDSDDVPIKDLGFFSKTIAIGNNVWIGRGVCIMPGVTIGDNCVIGAHSLVTRDIPPNSVAWGCPAARRRELRKEG